MHARQLYHFPLCPFSRKVRICLHEKGITHTLVKEDIWRKRPEFLAMNPANDLPVLMEPDGSAVTNHQVITEFLEEQYPEHKLLGDTPLERAEVRRVVAWFDTKFYTEVSRYLLRERIYRYFAGEGTPHAAPIRAAKQNIHYHLDYIAFLTQKHSWLCGNRFTLADIAAAAHISVADYLGDVPWPANEEARHWYALVKSRPAFAEILKDRVAGFAPPSYYVNPDF
ncbi:MAG: glutathione S-transferase [Rickettsiales bacterium]|nr:glutathione S-transferase [Rickettsiales bacterium]